jgi:phosphomannomutase
VPAALDQVFKAYDVRGVYPDQLDEELAERVGRAFVALTGAGTLAIGQDMRPSSKPMADALAAGATSQGADVLRVGLCSTDMLYYVSGALDVAGVMLTASHNPARYNGIKLCLAGAKPVGQDTGLAEIKALAQEGPSGDSGSRGSVSNLELVDRYADHVRSFVDRDALRPLHVIADTANGMGGLVVPRVFEELPFKLEILFPELDGNFPNHPPDPIQAENLKALQERVLEVNADVGLAFDGDADRVFLVDDKAQPISGSTTTALVAKAMLEKNPGSTIIYNLICSKSVAEIIEENGGVPKRSRVGHSFIKSVMAETDAVFGGEHSGHYYFRDNYRADSGLVAAVIVLEQLSKNSEPLSEYRQSFERYADSGEINVEVDDPAAVLDRVADHFEGAEQDRTDGLTLDFGEWWVNLRPSNTEPLLRVNLEAPDEDSCKQHLSEVLDIVRGDQ